MTTKSRAKRIPKTVTEAAVAPFPLAEEVRTYDALLADLADREGQFVLIKGREVLGFYQRHEEALEDAYERLGGGPFLVKQILLHEPIYQLGQIEL